MFTLYTANVIGNQKNKVYPNKIKVYDEETLKNAVKNDYVCATYKDNSRSDDNFIMTDCLPVDCDNDTTDDPSKWLTVDKLKAIFPDVSFAIHYSRNHMKDKIYKDKNGEVSKVVKARPRFHVFFEIDEMSDRVAYRNFKNYLSINYPYFDNNALDAARFFFGTEDPNVEYIKGSKNLSQFLDEEDFDKDFSKIKEGSRNSTMSIYASKVLKRFGNTEKARELFDKKSLDCDPLLEDDELETIWNSAIRFFNKISKEKGYISPEDYEGVKGLWPADYSDMGEALILVDNYKAQIIYTAPTGYLVYNGEFWKESAEMATGVMMSFLDKQLEDANKEVEEALENMKTAGFGEEILILSPKKRMDEADSDDKVDALTRYEQATNYKNFVMKYRNYKYINSTLQVAVPLVLHDINELDRDPYLLNTPDGTYDLKTGAKKDKDPLNFITKQTSVSPSTEGLSIWLDALDTFFQGNSELIDYVQKIVGLAAIGKVMSELLIIAYGDGRNGKSTFWNSIARVLGNYSGAISADSLTVGCKRNVKPELAELKGKRLVIAAELEEGVRMNTSIVKQLSSTDPIHAEKKYKPPFEFIPSHLTVLYTNHLPRVGAIDSGTWRRIKVIPFNAKIEGKKDIKNYTDYLVEKAGGAILTWVIEGARKAETAGGKIAEPSVVINATERYKEKNNWMQQFIDDMCLIDKDAVQKSGEFYNEYRNYCLRNGECTRSTTDFYAELENLGFFRKKSNKGTFIYGISIKKDTDF